jgi:Ubiquitin-conjugating enzyme
VEKKSSSWLVRTTGDISGWIHGSHEMEMWNSWSKKDQLGTRNLYRLSYEDVFVSPLILDCLFCSTVTFPDDYPAKPPECRFNPPLFHPNIWPEGDICLSILNVEKSWRPTISMIDILKGLQALLDDPNPSDPANREASDLFKTNPVQYKKRILDQASQHQWNEK